MQKVGHTYKNIHPIFDELERFYYCTSEREYKSGLIKPTFDIDFSGIIYYFNTLGKTNYRFNFVEKDYEPLKLPKYDSKNMIVCFSGGKDSTATALHYKKRGYNVYLYHVKGINKSYPDEWKQAQKIAEYLDMPLYIDEYKMEGKLDIPDHPMKNMIIANGAIHYGIANNIGIKIAPGNYQTSYLDDNPFYYSGDDCVEMWVEYEYIIQKVIPKFKIYLGLENVKSTINLLSKDLKLMELCLSCVGAQRFRAWNKQRIESKYNIKLLENRCGTCWKCCLEYIYLCDMGQLEYNKDYYRHCLNVLKKTNETENNKPFTTWKDLWDDFLFYPIKRSTFFKNDNII